MKHLLTFSKTMAAWLALLLVGLFMLPSKVAAQISFRDDFDYPEGNLYGQGGWVRYGSQTVDPIQVVGTPLTYPISTNAYWQLITNRKARISSLKQLSDKMIAMARYSATDYLTDLAIDSGKPKYDVYRVQINDVQIRLRMLLNNEMDAMLLPEPQATKARLEQHVLLMDSRDKNLQLGAIAFRQKAMKEPRRQDQLKKFLQAYNIAVDSINARGVQHYARILTKYCHVDNKTIAALPKIKFNHAMEPRRHDFEVAQRVANH